MIPEQTSSSQLATSNRRLVKESNEKEIGEDGTQVLCLTKVY